MTIDELRSETQSEFKDVRSEMQSEFRDVRSEMRAEIRAEGEITRRHFDMVAEQFRDYISRARSLP